jgi:hypothetical protein
MLYSVEISYAWSATPLQLRAETPLHTFCRLLHFSQLTPKWSWCTSWSGQCHSTPVYQLCVIMYNIVIFHSYWISVWHNIQRVNPTLLNCITVCSNVGICYCFSIGVKWHHQTDWLSTKMMYCCWNMEAAHQICLYFALVKSFGVAVCWNSKDDWCSKEVPGRNVNGREAVCSGSWKMSNFSVTNRSVWILNCGPSTRSACIKGMLL